MQGFFDLNNFYLVTLIPNMFMFAERKDLLYFQTLFHFKFTNVNDLLRPQTILQSICSSKNSMVISCMRAF